MNLYCHFLTVCWNKKQKNLNSGEHLYKYVLAYKKHWFLNEISRTAFRESSESFSFHTENDYGAYMTRFFSFERACLFGFKSAPPRLPWSIAAVFVLSLSPARSSRVMGWRPLTESRCFALLGSGLAQILGQMVSIGVKALSNANLGASKHVKRKKSWLPVDVRRSKTPLLQPATHSFLCTYQCYAGAGERQGMGWGFDFFQKFAIKFPAHGQIIPVKCNQISPPQAAHCCQSQGRTQERQNKNIS